MLIRATTFCGSPIFYIFFRWCKVLEIKLMALSDLKPADYNPRVELVPGMEEYEKLKQSILEFGFVDPPIFNKRTGNLVGGHQRVSVAKDLGLYEKVEVSVVDFPLNKEKLLNVALNKIDGKWDEVKLADLLSELDDDELVLSGYNEKELDKILDSLNDEDGEIYDGLPKEFIPPETFALNVIVDSESEQSQLFDELNERGFVVKVVNL